MNRLFGFNDDTLTFRKVYVLPRGLTYWLKGSVGNKADASVNGGVYCILYMIMIYLLFVFGVGDICYGFR